MRLPFLATATSLSFLAAACGQSGTGSTSTSTGSGGSEATATSSATTGTGGAASTGTATSSATGTGGAATSTSTSTGTGTGTSSATTGAGGGGGGMGNHLVISEVGVTPAAGEFVEIYNPGPNKVDLSTYYISDNSAYYGIAAGMPWAPVTNNPGTDFLAQFPAGTELAAGAAIVIATDPGFEGQFKKCPDFILSTSPLTCMNGTAKAMVAPTNGGIGDKAGAMLSNDREMVMLFQWDGVAMIVKDVDYVTWGTMFDNATRADKTGVMGYLPDTARASQKSATAPTTFQSIERCKPLEPGETLMGGNGISGHDETSEDLGMGFQVQATPTPGAKNGCL
jgi:Lamin Tail Domain